MVKSHAFRLSGGKARAVLPGLDQGSCTRSSALSLLPARDFGEGAQIGHQTDDVTLKRGVGVVSHDSFPVAASLLSRSAKRSGNGSATMSEYTLRR